MIVGLCAIPLVLWARTAPLDSRFTGSFTSLTSIAVVFAFAGVSAFAVNLVLGARLRVVEALFAGLEPMYKAHRVTGRVAFGLLLGHVVLILAGRATISSGTALELLGPGAGWTVFAGVIAFSLMTVCIVLTLFVRLGHEVFVYVQRTFGFVFLVAMYHVFMTPGAKAASPSLKAYIATLAGLGVAAFAYRSLFGNVLVRRHRYRVKAVNRLDEFVTEIVMDPLEERLRFTPGQFLFVNFRSIALSEQFHPFELLPPGRSALFSIRAGEVSNQFHPFSITSAPDEPTLRITVKAVGDYTRALRKLEAGADAIVEGPYGSFSHRNAPNRKQIWIAGGIGVTPFLSMARSLDGDDEPSVDFYYGVEREPEAHFIEEFWAIADRRDDFRVFPVVREEVGFLTAERVAEQSGDISSRDLLICGPPAMIESLKPQFLGAGVPAGQIYAEEFRFAKLGRGDARPRGHPRRAYAGFAAGAFALYGFFWIVVVVGGYAGSPAGGSRTAPVASASAPTSGGAGSAAAGKAVFSSAGCTGCHTLEAAGSHATAGPNLDESKPDVALVREVVTNGKGAMPPFKDQLTDQQIRDVAAFVSQSAGG